MASTPVYFYGASRGEYACLSQFYPASFEEDGVRYSSAEQYMMAAKARVMGDDASLAKILAEHEPARVKRLGRGVSPWDEEAWRASRCGVVERGNLLKFGQNAQLRETLLSTGTRRLAEASPSDRVWGIGIGVAAAQRGDKWNGQNLLGRALERTRDALRCHLPPPVVPGRSRLALDLGGVLSVAADTDDCGSGKAVAATLESTRPSPTAVAAVAEMVTRFGRDNVFVLSKCKARVRLATIAFLSAPSSSSEEEEDSRSFFDATGLLPRNVIFCARRSGGEPVKRFLPLTGAALDGPRVTDPEDCGKGRVARALGLTHLIDDRAECLHSFYREGLASPDRVALFHFSPGAGRGVDPSSSRHLAPNTDEAPRASSARPPCFWADCTAGWPDVLAALFPPAAHEQPPPCPGLPSGDDDEMDTDSPQASPSDSPRPPKRSRRSKLNVQQQGRRRTARVQDGRW